MCAQVAACLTGAALPAGSCAARMMLFVGGPSTEGAGKVVDRELSEPIRSHEVSPCHQNTLISVSLPHLMQNDSHAGVLVNSPGSLFSNAA